MTRNIIFALAAVLAGTVSAQETYENARLITQDLNGTARYVGMGGAMGALGADLSAISSNPAGIGLFRHSSAQVSFGFVTQPGVSDFADASKTNMSFDQAGFVFSHRSGKRSFVNVAFNYHKSTNFNHILAASGSLSGASQNKLSYLKHEAGLIDMDIRQGEVLGRSNLFNTVDYLYYNAMLTTFDESGNPVYGFRDASGYAFRRGGNGYIGVYDLNISGNIDDRVYLGLTIGIHDVNYNSYSEYSETIVPAGAEAAPGVTVADSRIISGTGVDVKMGVIFRPLKNSPFRVGLSVATPIWYDLSTRNFTTIGNNTSSGLYGIGSIEDAYDFKLRTPWQFGLSVGTTVGRSFAIGAEYNFANYGKTDTRINDGGGYDWYYDDYYETSSSDRGMNNHTDFVLKGVSTFKIGAEYKPRHDVAIRLGYNYVSPMYNKNGFKDFSIDSPGSYYSSATDYTNWKATNRVTCGLGYTVKKFNIDLAYQYTITKGDFYPFTSYSVGSQQAEISNMCTSADVDNKRHQLLLTFGYTL